MSIPMILTSTGIAFVVDNKQYSATNDHPRWVDIISAAREGRFSDLIELVSIPAALKSFLNGVIQVNEELGTITYKGQPVDGSIVGRIMDMLKSGFDVNPLVNFLNNLYDNPSRRAVQELYQFLEYGKMPITEDGHFLAYKRVRSDYKSVHDGKTDNSIGSIVEMPRNQVDDCSDNTCSYGLHFCSHEYLRSFSGEKVVILKINPRDVVSIPTDYNNTKGRACRYEVVGELSEEEVKKALGGSSVWNSSVVDYDDRDTWEESSDEEETSNQFKMTEHQKSLFEKAYQEGFNAPIRNINAIDEAYDDLYRDLHKDKNYLIQDVLWMNNYVQAAGRYFGKETAINDEEYDVDSAVIAMYDDIDQ